MRCSDALHQRALRPAKTFHRCRLKDAGGMDTKSARLKKIARHLLATTCLTAAAAGSAGAATFKEGTDFSNTFAGANALPLGTDVVNGSLFGSLAPDVDDYLFCFSCKVRMNGLYRYVGGSGAPRGAKTDSPCPGSSRILLIFWRAFYDYQTRAVSCWRRASVCRYV